MSADALEVQVAVAKVGKYAASESGDTVEMIERPNGGISLVVADGQWSGRGAKRISNLVARKTLSLLSEGVRDGAAARAAHDCLYTYRGGKVQSTLNIVSIDLSSRTVVLSRNSHCPVIVVRQDGTAVLDEPSSPVGIHQYTRPSIVEVAIECPLCVVVFTDGLLTAGQRYGQHLDVVALVTENYRPGERQNAQALADILLNEALSLDRGRAADDMSVLTVSIVPAIRHSDEHLVRRMAVTFPISQVREYGPTPEGQPRTNSLA